MSGCEYCGGELVGRQRRFCKPRHAVLWRADNPAPPVHYDSCQQCGKPIERSSHRPRKYCGKKCANKAGNERRAPDFQPSDIILECKHCLEYFRPTTKANIFCSVICKDKHHYYTVGKSQYRAVSKKPKEMNCDWCHTPYLGLPGAKFCSNSCHREELLSHHNHRSLILSSATW